MADVEQKVRIILKTNLKIRGSEIHKETKLLFGFRINKNQIQNLKLILLKLRHFRHLENNLALSSNRIEVYSKYQNADIYVTIKGSYKFSK